MSNISCLASLVLASVSAGGALGAEVANTFRVTPYVQDPSTAAITLMWLAQTNGSASVSWWKLGGATTNTIAEATQIEPSDRIANCRFTGTMRIDYCRAPELDYDCSPIAADNTRNRYGAWEMPYTCPWQYRCRLTGLSSDTTYGYRVTLAGGATYEKTFRTAPGKWRTVRFVYYSDSETEPKDNDPVEGLTTDWGFNEQSGRAYYATQTRCYASNIVHAVAFNPDLILMAGDLAQKGSKQCDWDEFWRHNAGQLNDPAGSIPILAAPGNHDYWDYGDGGNTAISKYLSYFEFAPNGTALNEKQQELFHRLDYGPVAFIFIDGCNGNDDVLAEDTSRYLNRTSSSYGAKEGCLAPDFNPGSVQYQWLAEQLADAQRTKAFTFVVCHFCPYSCGYHGGEIAEIGTPNRDAQTGRALRALEPLFHHYGVDAWLCGHDEMMERSEIEGTEALPDGTERPNTIHVWDMGIAGDGLRGGVVYGNVNPKEKFRAGKDAVEQFDANGTLVAGGRHYGHMEVEVSQGSDGLWRATFSPTYVFVTTNASGQACGFEKRTYDDVQTLVSSFAGAPSRRTRTGWLDESVATLGTTGTWTPSQPATQDERVVFDDEDEESYVVTPRSVEPANTTTVCEADIVFGEIGREEDATGEAQAGLFLAPTGTGDELGFACLTADGWRTNAVAGLTVSVEENYHVRIQLAYTNAVPTIDYAVRVGTAYVPIASGPSPKVQSRLNRVRLIGEGSFGRLKADYSRKANGNLLYIR